MSTRTRNANRTGFDESQLTTFVPVIWNPATETDRAAKARQAYNGPTNACVRKADEDFRGVSLIL